jgi:outer membrane protein OmpA-like peptidoglycan-associated protein
VRDAFINKFGVNANMLKEKGYGKTKPRPGNQNRNDDEKFQNRRIEYTVLSK